jgi:CBS domain-containing protein
MLKVADILRAKDTRIITVRMGETLEVAAMLMNRENVGALVVKDVCRTEGNVVVGVFSERDLARAIATYRDVALRMPVSRFLGHPLVACGEHDSIDHVARVMTERQVRLLPVLHEHTLIGVISISDVVAHLADTEVPAPITHLMSAAAATETCHAS